VLDYLSYFESAYLIQTVPCFAWSAKKQALAPKKLYITDNGIIRTGSASYTRNMGALFENMLFNALRVRTADICYYADKTGECDFVLDSHKDKPLLMQACVELTRDNEEREIRGLVNALAFFDLKEGVVITRDQRDTILEAGKRIAVIPAWDFIGKYEAGNCG
jgi:predicted AAA+ superfamily ATPase